MLARTRRTLGFLRSISFETMLDVGSGRVVFLIPFMKEFPWVQVTSLDVLEKRVQASVEETKKVASSDEAQTVSGPKSQLNSKDIIDMMVMMAEIAMEKDDFAAADQYKNILKLEPNETAQYNLGSLYAQGKGVGQDFMEGAYWFRQAELSGDEQAGKLCMKCSMDFVHQDFDIKSPQQLYRRPLRAICGDGI